MDPLLTDLLSGDAQRIWSATSAITTLRDAQELDTLAAHLAEIQAKTDGVPLGGALMPNSERLKFALRKLAYWRDKEGCLCRLYPEWLMFDPKKEEAAGNIRILRTETDGAWTVGYDCRCAICGTDYAVEGRRVPLHLVEMDDSHPVNRRRQESPMTCIRIQIVGFVEEHQPNIVEGCLVEASGRVRTFIRPLA